MGGSAGRGKGRLPDPPEEKSVRVQITLKPTTLSFLRWYAEHSTFDNPTLSRIITALVRDYQIQNDFPETKPTSDWRNPNANKF